MPAELNLRRNSHSSHLRFTMEVKLFRHQIGFGSFVESVCFQVDHILLASAHRFEAVHFANAEIVYYVSSLWGLEWEKTRN